MRRLAGLAAWIIAALFLLALQPDSALAVELRGKVVAVIDGDTFDLLTRDSHTMRIRLTEVDAPERSQPWGARAKQALSVLVFGRAVSVRTSATDRYGRTLGRVTVGRRDVNAALVQQGDAWAYRAYLTDPRMLALEGEARAGHRGLWALPGPERTAPWAWRQDQEHSRPTFLKPAHRLPDVAVVSRMCGAKSFCREMASCEEAKFYLNQCRVTRLDGDGDGVPCEALCTGR